MTIAYESFSASHDTQLSAEQIFKLQHDMENTSEAIRTNEITDFDRVIATSILADNAIRLANSAAPDLLKVTTLSKIAGNTGSIVLRDIALEQLSQSYPTTPDETLSPEIRDLNRETQQEYLAAMLYTDEKTTFTEALQQAEHFVDLAKGRDFYEDVYVPTEEAALKAREAAERIRILDRRDAIQRQYEEEMRAIRREEIKNGTFAPTERYDPFADDDLE